uniref:Ephrin type-B receptor 1-like n=1 Tax=Petromyzon marinus TaxID=7757 RepID=A0AAJ7UI33_PETMA|nr:ephrin type-B receptor 1-like [Petromyzon marinus]
MMVLVVWRWCGAPGAGVPGGVPGAGAGAGGGGGSLVRGSCVRLAEEWGPVLRRCTPEGAWSGPVGPGRCACSPGASPDQSLSSCQLCAVGLYKAEGGLGGCGPCPARSHAVSLGATACACEPGYYRADTDGAHLACTGVPSEPRALSVTPLTASPTATATAAAATAAAAVALEWLPPADTGGRDDLRYNVICRACPLASPRSRHSGTGGSGTGAGAGCIRCDSHLSFWPGRLDLPGTRVEVAGLAPLTLYALEVQALNGVSALSPLPPRSATAQYSLPAAESMPAVPIMHQEESGPQSLTLVWPPPDHPVLGYQLCYYIKGQDRHGNASRLLEVPTARAEVRGLSPATVYAFRVRSVTPGGGYGQLSGEMYFQTEAAGGARRWRRWRRWRHGANGRDGRGVRISHPGLGEGRVDRRPCVGRRGSRPRRHRCGHSPLLLQAEKRPEAASVRDE